MAVRITYLRPQSPCLFVEKIQLVVFKPDALRPVTTATNKARPCFWFPGLWPEIQATRFAGGR